MDPSMFVNMIIRPPRSDYQDPGSFEKNSGGKDYKCESFQIVNTKGEKL